MIALAAPLFGFWAWAQIYLTYLVAAALFGSGFYLAFVLVPKLSLTPLRLFGTKLLRGVGHILMYAGLLLGAVTFGKSIGASECEARWKEKNYEAQIARLTQEKDGQKLAAQIAANQAKDIADENEANLKKVSDYANDVAKLSTDLIACRRANRDDDRRMCEILGSAAPGCKPPG